MFPLKYRKVIRDSDGHIRAGLGVGTDYQAEYDPLYAPFDGYVELYKGQQGGNWLRMRKGAFTVEMAHLDGYSVSNGEFVAEGQKIAKTGNTGSITDFPHLHIQIFKNGVRIDPEEYNWMNRPFKFKVLVEHYGEKPEDVFNQVNEKIKEISEGGIELEIDYKHSDLSGYVLSSDTMDKLAQSNNGYHCQYFIYKSTQVERPWHFTSYSPSKNCALVSDPYKAEFDSVIFEIGHALAKYYSSNRPDNAPAFENLDLISGNISLLITKIKQLTPLLSYLDNVDTNMKREELDILYEVLEIQDEDESGRNYWVDKPLISFLKEYAKNKGNKLIELSK